MRAILVAAILLGSACALSLFAAAAPAQDLQAQLSSVQQKQSAVGAALARDNSQVNSLIGQVSALRQSEAALQHQLELKQAELDRAAVALAKERRHLQVVRAQLKRALMVLRQYLIQVYEVGSPDLLSVIVNSASWSDLVAQSDYLSRIQGSQNADIVRVKTLRDETRNTVARLTAARDQLRAARDAIAAHQRQLASTRASLQGREAQLIAARSARRKVLDSLSGRASTLQNNIAQAQAQLGGSTLSAPGGPTVSGSGQTAGLSNGNAVPPGSAPQAVKDAIAAANQIDNTPYVWGGGHGSFSSSGYDCSGAVSFALHGGGFLSSPLDSTGLESWGAPGPGSWITVYANSGHAFAVIAGLRWDTVGTNGSGPRWQTGMVSTGGFVARHPPGY